LAEFNRAEKKLLQAAVETGSSNRMTLDDLAEKTGRSPQFVYEKLKDPEFRAVFVEGLKTSLVAETPEILKKFAELGKEGSYKHGKLILEITKVYSEETKVNVDANVTTTENPFKNEEDKAEFMKATLEKYINFDHKEG